MATDVSMDFDVVERLADGFQGATQTLQAVDQTLETAVALLKGSAFIGMVGNLALAGYLENIRPHVTRLAEHCAELNADLLGAIRSLRDGDYSGSQRFVGGGGGGGASSGMVGIGDAPGAKKPPTPGGNVANLSNYQDGVNGWELIPMSGDFTPGELVSQTGPSCTIYGAMNLLIENGYDISQAQADQIYQQHLKSWDLNVWFDMADGKHDSGFGLHHATDILDQYGADYTHDDFSTWLGLGSPDRSAAESFLIEQAKAGNPVYVTTEVDDTFGIAKGAHAYTVLGVQTDSSGKMTKVLVSTNWGGQQAWEIPADKFMDDWMGHNDGEYIVIEK